MCELLEVNDKGYTLGLYLFIFMMASFMTKMSLVVHFLVVSILIYFQLHDLKR